MKRWLKLHNIRAGVNLVVGGCMCLYVCVCFEGPCAQ